MAKNKKEKTENTEKVDDGIEHDDLIIETAFKGQAVFANRSAVSLVNAGVRLGFVEQSNSRETAEFRTAVILGMSDAIQLKTLLTKMLKPIEEEISALEKEIIEKQKDA